MCGGCSEAVEGRKFDGLSPRSRGFADREALGCEVKVRKGPARCEWAQCRRRLIALLT